MTVVIRHAWIRKNSLFGSSSVPFSLILNRWELWLGDLEVSSSNLDNSMILL